MQIPRKDRASADSAWKHKLFASSSDARDFSDILGTIGILGEFLGRVKHNWGFLPMILSHVLGFFLLGVLAWRKRVFHPTPESLPRYRTAMAWGLAVGVTGDARLIAAWGRLLECS